MFLDNTRVTNRLVLRRFVMALYPESELSGRAPPELERSSNAQQLKNSYHFWQWGEVLYARKKEVAPQMSFSDTEFSPFWCDGCKRSHLCPGFSGRRVWKRRRAPRFNPDLACQST